MVVHAMWVMVGVLAGQAGRGLRSVAAAGDCTVSAADVALDADEKEFLRLINDYRVANGRQPLRISYMLTRASMWKSKDMGVNGYFAHDDTPSGRTWSGRISDCGYNHGTYIGENIAAGYPSAAAVFDAGWLTVHKGRSWASMGARYERTTTGPADTPRGMWDELDHGRDPTA